MRWDDLQLLPGVADRRPRGHATVAALAGTERLRPVPRRPYHAVVQATRKVSWAALVSFEGNRYSVPPQFVNAQVVVSWRLGEPHVVISSVTGEVSRGSWGGEFPGLALRWRAFA